jgi:hypothetical protein
VVQAFVNEGRFDVLERANFTAIEAERFLQEAMSPEQQQKLSELGARWIVVGEVNQVSMSEKRSDSGATFEATLAFGLRILDVKTGKVAYTEQFSNNTGNVLQVFSNLMDDRTSPGSALQAALKDIGKPLGVFLDRAFPVVARVLSVEKFARNGSAAEVLIPKGVADGITPKTKLIVFTRSTIDVGGEKLVREKPIGELTVIRSEGEHISLCKVTKGGDVIAQRLDGNKAVYIKVKL